MLQDLSSIFSQLNIEHEIQFQTRQQSVVDGEVINNYTNQITITVGVLLASGEELRTFAEGEITGQDIIVWEPSTQTLNEGDLVHYKSKVFEVFQVFDYLDFFNLVKYTCKKMP